MPIFMIVLFALCVLMLAGAILVLWVFPGREIAKKVPAWIVQAAYPVLMLCLPVVMLVITMLIFPCFWQNCK